MTVTRTIARKRSRSDSLYEGVTLGISKRTLRAAMATSEAIKAYGKDMRVVLRKMLKRAHTEQQILHALAAALILGFKVESFTRRGKTVYEINDHIALALAPAPNGTGRGGGRDPLDQREADRIAALAFYMCWRFRQEENPALGFLSKDTALHVCVFMMEEQLRAIQ